MHGMNYKYSLDRRQIYAREELIDAGVTVCSTELVQCRADRHVLVYRHLSYRCHKQSITDVTQVFYSHLVIVVSMSG